ncbi:MAG: S8/S53 family peptidase [Oligoflexia bacterium]|nr:S8/S53 family peptidase [Oligoflexia bacterium]
MKFLWPLVRLCSLYSLCFSFSFSPVHAALNCYGLSLSWDSSEEALRTLIEEVAPTPENLQQDKRDPLLYSYTVKEMRPLAWWWPLYYQLQGYGGKKLEILCEDPTASNSDEVLENRKEWVYDSFCLNTTAKDWEENPLYASCDPLWIHKLTGLLQKNAQGEWSGEWMQELLLKRQQAMREEITSLKSSGRIEEASRLQQQHDEMALWGEGVLVGHPDTGYTDHPELNPKEQIDHPENFTLFNSNARDSRGYWKGHGTSTASVIISPDGRQVEGEQSQGPLSQYVLGVAPRARIRPYRVSTGNVIHLIYPNLIAAIYSAIDNNRRNDVPELYHEKVKVLSMSLGGPLPSYRLHRALNKALEAGIIPVAAAGNYIPETFFHKGVVWPARYNETIAATATNVYNNPWAGSSRGKSVDVAAPGESVWRAQTTYADGREYAYGSARSSGTSYATAIIAGVIANWSAFHSESKLKEYDPYRIDLFRYILKKLSLEGKLGSMQCDQDASTCSYIKAGAYGKGVINAKAILEEPLPPAKEFLLSMDTTHPRRGANEQGDEAANLDINREVLQDYYPEIKAKNLDRALGVLLSLSSPQLDLFLENVGYEFTVHLVNQTELFSLLEYYLKLKQKIYDSNFIRAPYLSLKYRRELRKTRNNFHDLLKAHASLKLQNFLAQ